MESANIHHHHHLHLQDQLVGSSSSSNSVSLATTTTTPSCFGFATSTTTHAWGTTNSILNTNGYIPRQQENTSLISSVPYTSMAPDLGFHWANNFSGNDDYHSTQDLQNSRVKEVFSDNYYLKYTEMLTSSPSSTTTDDQFIPRNEHKTPNDHLNTKQLLKSFSFGNLYPNASINGGRGFSQIYPSVNVSDLNQTGLTSQAGSFDMNLQALDLLTSSRFNGDFNLYPQNQILRDGFSYGFDHMQQPHEMPIYSTSKISASSSSNEIGGEGKRTSSKMEQPKAIQTAPKKSRVEERSSCPPLKVRKEKLGDRIAALQQLVAPFGKTDTASVLMEAIGYIKFLQDQVETLSVPYMKTSRNKPNRAIQGGGAENENHEEQNRDLKCRGLCLVPLSCLSYMTDGGGGGAVWPPPHFGGAT